jgi:galactose mutarotase-like enzyme
MNVFGQMPDGRDVHAIDLKSELLSVRILTFGASLQTVSFQGKQTLLGSETIAVQSWGGSQIGLVKAPQ